MMEKVPNGFQFAAGFWFNFISFAQKYPALCGLLPLRADFAPVVFPGGHLKAQQFPGRKIFSVARTRISDFVGVGM